MDNESTKNVFFEYIVRILALRLLLRNNPIYGTLCISHRRIASYDI